jgi:ABC-type sugar transport system ATPase subunit
VTTTEPNTIDAVDLSRSYGAVTALRNATFTIKAREIVGFAGDNGAGKSTLLKIIGGADNPTGGTLTFCGTKRGSMTPERARGEGVEVVYQDLALCDNLNVYENIFLGRELVTNVAGVRRLSHSRMRERSHQLLERLGVELTSMLDPVSTLSGGQKQMVAICRATAFEPKLIIMDEPTAALSVQAAQPLLELIRKLPEQGTSVMLVSHRLSDMLSTAQRIYVMRHGETVAVADAPSSTEEDILHLMSGITPASQS